MPYKSTKTITYRSTNSVGQTVPAIILQGDFLRGFGFEVGGKVKVEYSKYQIIIKSDEYTSYN